MDDSGGCFGRSIVVDGYALAMYVCLPSSTDYTPLHECPVMLSDGAVDVGHVDVSLSRVQA